MERSDSCSPDPPTPVDGVDYTYPTDDTPPQSTDVAHYDQTVIVNSSNPYVVSPTLQTMPDSAIHGGYQPDPYGSVATTSLNSISAPPNGTRPIRPLKTKSSRTSLKSASHSNASDSNSIPSLEGQAATLAPSGGSVANANANANVAPTDAFAGSPSHGLLNKIGGGTRLSLAISGDLMTMAVGWSHVEWESRRRLVQFWRRQDGAKIECSFMAIQPEHYVDGSIVISCIFREETNECYVSSVLA